jgi:phospholipid/cholesterol/gamma-HCH transport system substrate-binding protein
MFGEKYTLYGTFRNVGGLQPGNLVRFNGINVGTVESINFTNDTSVTVALRVQARVKHYIKRDAIAGIGSDGLMGDKMVIISPGAGNAIPLVDGSYIHTKNPMDLEKSIAKFNKVIENATEITNTAAGITRQISSGKGSIGRLLYDEKLARGLEKTVDAAHGAAEEMHSTVSAVHNTVNAVRGTVDAARGTVDAMRRTVDKVHDAIDTAQLTLKAAQRGANGFADNMDIIKHALDTAGLAFKAAHRGAEGFADNMDAVKHTIILRGYFKKKARAEAQARKRDSLSVAGIEPPKSKREARRNRQARSNGQKPESTGSNITGIAR